jgi:osmoprotectant transport system ATP-binding protein
VDADGRLAGVLKADEVLAVIESARLVRQGAL